MSEVSMKIANNRLLRLADILENAKKYYQGSFIGIRDKKIEAKVEKGKARILIKDCKTTACALGHWAANNPSRWQWTGEYPALRVRNTDGLGDAFKDAQEEFLLTGHEVNELFGAMGCANAGGHAKKAARYIRAFANKRIAEQTLEELSGY